MILRMLDRIAERVGTWHPQRDRANTALYALVVFDACLEQASRNFRLARMRFVWPVISAARKLTTPDRLTDKVSRTELIDAFREMRRELGWGKKDAYRRDLGEWLNARLCRVGDQHAVAIFEIPMVRRYAGPLGHSYHSYSRFTVDDINMLRNAARDAVGTVVDEWNGLGMCTASFKVRLPKQNGDDDE